MQFSTQIDTINKPTPIFLQPDAIPVTQPTVGALKGKRVGMSESAVSEKLTLDAAVRLFKCFPCRDILRFYCFHFFVNYGV